MKGFLVIDSADDFEQPLGLEVGKMLPPGGVLVWTNGPRDVFQTRGDAQEAIKRTDHYRLAFARKDLPERKNCKIVPVRVAIGKGEK